MNNQTTQHVNSRGRHHSFTKQCLLFGTDPEAVIGDGLDLMDQGAKAVEDTLQKALESPSPTDPFKNGYLRAKMLNGEDN